MKRAFHPSMKVILMLLFTINCSLFTSFSQSPNMFSYQAVVRNSGGILVQNANVGFKISILQGTPTGTVVYSETQVVATNTNGLASLQIGGGTVVSGTFSTIDWSAGPYFLKNETDPTGGTSYTISGTTQLLSVPYALYAAKSGTPSIAAGSVAGNTPYWNGSLWVTNSSNIFNNGGNIGIGTATPAARFDILGGNNWDVVNGEGDFRVGNNLYRLRLGVALGGGGAGAVGIMQYGQPGGYNVLSLGSQGTNLLFLNGNSQKVGVGTDNPNSTLDIRGTLSVVDGTQGAGKVLTSDANGKASWTGGPHYIGESYGGGIVFYVYDNGQHGLIAATVDQSTGVVWATAAFQSTVSNAGRDGVKGGLANTERIIIQEGAGSYAAQLCANYQGGDYADWYLPSKYELNLLYLQQAVVATNNTYWSSTEGSSSLAWEQVFANGSQYMLSKGLTTVHVRAIRAF